MMKKPNKQGISNDGRHLPTAAVVANGNLKTIHKLRKLADLV